MQRMIRQFAAEYTSETSSTQDFSSPSSTKNQSLLKASPVASSPAAATAQNHVLSRFLMADQDSPLDLTVRKSQLDPSEQDGVLDLSTKKSPCAGNASSSHSPGCSAAPGNGEDTEEAVAVDCLGQPKSSLEKIMVRLCTFHQKHFVRVLNDICSEVQTGCEGQQVPGSENMEVSTCSSGCSQYCTEDQDLGSSCSESKLPLLLEPEQSGPHGSLRMLCHALKHAVELKSTDRRENCSPVVRRDFPELPTIKTTSASPRESPTQGYLIASNTHHSVKNLDGQTSASEQEMEVRKSEEDKDHPQGKGLLGGYIAVKASQVNINEDSLGPRVGSLKNPFKAFPEETREPAFSTSSPWRADKENALQCSSKGSVHQDTEVSDQETRSKVENHYLALAKSRGSYHVHPSDKTQVENPKDIWLPVNPMPVMHHKTNGHSRAKSCSVTTKSTRKSKRSSGLRINDYDNQCDVVYISQPITECHFENKKTTSAKKTARKSTRGYYYNGECCEVPTIRTLAKTSHVHENGNSLVPRPEAPASPSQGISLPVGSYLAAAEPAGCDGDTRSSPRGPAQEDSFNIIRAEQCPSESTSFEINVLDQREVSPVEAPTMPLPLLPCPVLQADKGNLYVSSLQTTTVSFPQKNEGELQDRTDLGILLEVHNGSDSFKSNVSNENSGNTADAVLYSIPEAVNNKSSLFLGNVTIPEQPIPTESDPSVSMDLLLPENSANSMDLLPSLDEPASIIDLLPPVEPPLLSPVNIAEHPTEPPALEVLTFSSEIPHIPKSVSPVEPVASPMATSAITHPAGVVPELPADINLDPLKIPSVESSVAITTKMDVELPQLLSNLDSKKLPPSFEGSNTHGSINIETSAENAQNLIGFSVECEAVVPATDTSENKGEENVEDAKYIGEMTKSSEEVEADNETPVALRTSEMDNKKEASSETNLDKKRKREKKTQVASDRCLRSQQSLSPTEDSTEQPSSSNSVQLPQLQIKLSKSPGAKRFKREVHLDGAASVCFPNDRFHQILLNDTGSTLEQQEGEGDDITIRQTYKKLLPKECVIEKSQNGEGNKSEPAAMLEICLEANSDKRSVHVPEETPDKTENEVDLKPEALESSDSTMNSTKILPNQHETSSPECPGSKNEGNYTQAEKMVKCKKQALQFYNLRHTPVAVPGSKYLTEKAIVEINSNNRTVATDTNVTDEQNARNENSLAFSSMEVFCDNKPRFVELCAEEDNQELITTFNTQYTKVQKGWIQLEKEVQPAPKVKNKSDKLKEIWKSKKRTRKFKGSTDTQKLSPVQMLFMKAFDISNVCKWFMETTETKSLVIVKKLNTRLPGDIPLLKLPLQKSCSSGIYPSSLQAERLKKHLKKFATMTPAKNTIKTQKIWAKFRETTEGTEPEPVVNPKQTPPSEVSLAHAIESKSVLPLPSMPVQTSSRILRKYSNLRGKLHGLHRVAKQEKSDCLVKHSLAENNPSHQTMCIKPLMSPKLSQQVKTIQLPTKSTLTDKGGKGKKGKGKSQGDISESNAQQSKKKTPNENIRTQEQGQLRTSSKERFSLKKTIKLKQGVAPATRKQTVAEKGNKHTTPIEKAKKLMDSPLGKKKGALHKGKASTGPKVNLLSRQRGFIKPLKQKMVQDSSSRPLKGSAKKAGSEKALTRSVKRIQENKAQSKRKLRAKKDSSPSKRRRLDAK